MICEAYTRTPTKTFIDLIAAGYVTRKLEAGKTMMGGLYSIMFETRTGQNELNGALRAHPAVEDWHYPDQSQIDFWLGKKHENSWISWQRVQNGQPQKLWCSRDRPHGSGTQSRMRRRPLARDRRP